MEIKIFNKQIKIKTKSQNLLYKIVHNENSKNLLKFDLIKLILSILKLNMKVYENINLPKINCFLYKIFIFKKMKNLK